MSLALLFPAALAALAALALPLLIHLARRSQQRPLEFAALRWIAVRQRPQRRIVFEEWLLLASRLLLLALLALFLAAPVLREADRAQDLVLVVPGVDVAQARAAGPADARWHWLAPGFPPLGDAVPGPVPVSSLLREIDSRLPAGAALTVFVPDPVGGLDGERVRLGRELDWRVVEATTPEPQVRPAPPRMALRHAPQRADAARYLRASVQAWQVRDARATALDVADTTALPGANVDTLVWLHPGPVPEAVHKWAAEGRTLVVEEAGDTTTDTGADEVPVWHDADASILATASALGHGRVIRLRQRLQPDALPQLLDPGFPDALHALLHARPAPDTGDAAGARPLHGAATAVGPGLDARQIPLRPWLALLIAALVLGERLLATRARRWAR